MKTKGKWIYVLFVAVLGLIGGFYILMLNETNLIKNSKGDNTFSVDVQPLLNIDQKVNFLDTPNQDELVKQYDSFFIYIDNLYSLGKEKVNNGVVDFIDLASSSNGIFNVSIKILENIETAEGFYELDHDNTDYIFDSMTSKEIKWYYAQNQSLEESKIIAGMQIRNMTILIEETVPKNTSSKMNEEIVRLAEILSNP